MKTFYFKNRDDGTFLLRQIKNGDIYICYIDEPPLEWVFSSTRTSLSIRGKLSYPPIIQGYVKVEAKTCKEAIIIAKLLIN